MIVQLPPDLVLRLVPELQKAGRREIGGVLVGEHVAEAVFRIVDLSVQRSGGGVNCFVRHPAKHRRFMTRFFERTGQAYERFNYLGEWHSHPSFEARPSSVDLAQMQAIVEEGPQAPHFALLLILRLADRDQLEFGALAFTAGCAPTAVTVKLVDRPEGDPAAPAGQGTNAMGEWPRSMWRWLCNRMTKGEFRWA